MKRIIYALLLITIAFSANAQSLVFFDSNDKEISQERFNELRKTGKYLAIDSDSINHKKLIYREQKATLDNFTTFKTLIEKQTGQKLSEISPTVILYYPGKDPCNSTGTTTPTSKAAWHKELQKGVWKLCETKPLYICKDISDMDGKGSSVLPWINDPEHIVEKTFFKHHYPCESFVVIAPNGEYFSFFGEFMKEQVWNTIKSMKKNQQ